MLLFIFFYLSLLLKVRIVMTGRLTGFFSPQWQFLQFIRCLFGQEEVIRQNDFVILIRDRNDYNIAVIIEEHRRIGMDY